MRKSESLDTILPILSLYVFAGYRLMPAIQQIYSSVTKIVFNGPSIDKLYKDLKNLKSLNETVEQKDNVSFNDKIELQNIFYNYPNSSKLL